MQNKIHRSSWPFCVPDTHPTHTLHRSARVHRSTIGGCQKGCCCCVVAGSKEGDTIGLIMLYGGRKSGANTKMRDGIWPHENIFGFFRAPSRLEREAERNPLTKRASSATLDAQSTATEVEQDPDMRRNVPIGALLSPQPKAREKSLGRLRAASQKKKYICKHARAASNCSLLVCSAHLMHVQQSTVYY